MKNNTFEQKPYSIVILAAGNSTRMGKPKLLLKFKGKTLVSIAASAAAGTGCKNIFIVTGASHPETSNELEATDFRLVYNKDWQDGISSSIKLGLAAVLEHKPSTEWILYMVADQPYINAEILSAIISMSAHTDKKIIASAYGGTLGTPAMFEASIFSELQNLSGDQGARSIIITNRNSVASIIFEEGKTDIDTPVDYEQLLTRLPLNPSL